MSDIKPEEGSRTLKKFTLFGSSELVLVGYMLTTFSVIADDSVVYDHLIFEVLLLTNRGLSIQVRC